MNDIRRVITVNLKREEEPVQILILYPNEVCVAEEYKVNEDQAKIMNEFFEKWLSFHHETKDGEMKEVKDEEIPVNEKN